MNNRDKHNSFIKNNFREIPKTPKVKNNFINKQSHHWVTDDPYKLGLEYFKKNNFELAARSFEEALDKDPENSFTRYSLALCYIHSKNYNNAILHLRKALSKENENYDFRLNLAECYIKQERFEQALNELDILLKVKDSKEVKEKIADIYYIKANNLKKDENYREAASNYLKAINMIPDNEIFLFEIADCYYKIGELNRSLNYYEKALPVTKNKKRLSDIYRYLAKINIILGNEDVVKDLCEKNLKIDPYNPISNFYLGEIYLKNENYDDALKKYLISLKGDPNFIASYMAIGQVYVMKGVPDYAINYYNKVLSIDKNHSQAWCNIGIIRYKQGNIPLALELLKKSTLNGESRNYLTYKYLGIIFLSLNDYKSAAENFEKAIEIDNTEIENYINLGFCFQKTGNIFRAIEEYQKALDIDFNNITALKNLSGIYYNSSRTREALELYIKIYSLEGESSIYCKLIANCFKKLGYYEDAIEFYEKYIEKYPNDYESKLFIGICYYELDDTDTSFDIFYELITVSKKEISNSFLYLSKIYDRSEQLEEAYDSARESAMTDIKNAEAFMQYARIALKVGDNERALTCLKKVLNLEPSNKEAQEIMKIFDSEKEHD